MMLGLVSCVFLGEKVMVAMQAAEAVQFQNSSSIMAQPNFI